MIAFQRHPLLLIAYLFLGKTMDLNAATANMNFHLLLDIPDPVWFLTLQVS